MPYQQGARRVVVGSLLLIAISYSIFYDMPNMGYKNGLMLSVLGAASAVMAR